MSSVDTESGCQVLPTKQRRTNVVRYSWWDALAAALCLSVRARVAKTADDVGQPLVVAGLVQKVIRPQSFGAFSIFGQRIVSEHHDRRSLRAKCAQHAETAALLELQVKHDNVNDLSAHAGGRGALSVDGCNHSDPLERREGFAQSLGEHLGIFNQQDA